MSLRSPLGKVIGLGSAKEGVGHWWIQRITAVGLLLLGPWFLIALLMLGDLSYASAVAWAAMPLNSALLTLLIVTVMYHGQLGLQVVVEDYVPHKGAKTVLLLAINFAAWVLGVLGVFSVLRIAVSAGNS